MNDEPNVIISETSKDNKIENLINVNKYLNLIVHFIILINYIILFIEYMYFILYFSQTLYSYIVSLIYIIINN